MSDTEPEPVAPNADDAPSFDPMLVDGAAPIPEAQLGAPDQELAPSDVLATVVAERDGYLDALQRLKAEFANHRRRNLEQATAQREQAAAGLVEKLLPVLDSLTAAIAHDPATITPINDSLLDTLRGQGLAELNPVGEAFDPEQHEAVLHEAGDGGPMVIEVLRVGYAWNGRVIRPAMVKVRG